MQYLFAKIVAFNDDIQKEQSFGLLLEIDDTQIGIALFLVSSTELSSCS